MDRLSFYVALLFYIAFVVYLYLGIYTISLNAKSTVNKIFMAVSVAVAFWALAFSIANIMPLAQEASFWRRMASLGWGSAYSFLFHFSLIFADTHKRFRNKWMMLFIYLPAIVNVVCFGVLAPLLSIEYSMVKINSGWINIGKNPGWDLYFNVYYLLFSFLAVVCFLLLIRKKNEIISRNQVIYLIVSFLVALAAGSITDIMAPAFFSIQLPQLGPVFIILPVFAMARSIKKYGLLKSPEHEKKLKLGQILTEEKRKTFYRFLSVAYFITSIINLSNLLLYTTDGWNVMRFSLSLIAIGVLVYLVPNTRLKTDIQDFLMSIIIAASVPMVLLKYYTAYSGNIVWPLPILFIMASAVFTRRRLLLIASGSTVLTLFYMWVHPKTHFVYISTIDYLFRLLITFSAVGIAYAINRIYLNRLRENEFQMAIQALISTISSDMVSVSLDNYEEKMKVMLKMTCEFLKIDRTFYYLFSSDKKMAYFQHGWYNEGSVVRHEFTEALEVSNYQWWMSQLQENGAIDIDDISEVPETALFERLMMERHQIKSLVCRGINGKQQLNGFLGFYSCSTKKDWHDNELNLVSVIANIIADALAKIEAEKEINQLAYHDALTGLANRRMFKQELNEYISGSPKDPLCVMFLDLDSFKGVNDTIGHEGGDDLLIEVARMLEYVIGSKGIVSRFGGDEFLILLKEAKNIENIKQLADRIMDLFASPITIFEHEFLVTTSAGIAMYPEDGTTASALIKNADLAMYTSKNKGKNQYTLCSRALKQEIYDRIQLSNDLRNAIQNKELVVYYQPQVDTQTKKIIGLEALLRWFHPTKGMISPAIFIPMAEESGSIHEIGEWVLREACTQTVHWQKMGYDPMRIAVNISVEQFKEKDLVDTVSDVLRTTELASKYLELEITESIAIIDATYITKTLYRLKELGVSISIDDFGTGYSSLNRLKELPIDRIKIAMQFIQGLALNEKDDAIARVIISLAKNLNMKVIAEGVETVEQQGFLSDHICDEIQGYYFYKPMPKEDIELLLSHKER